MKRFQKISAHFSENGIVHHLPLRIAPWAFHQKAEMTDRTENDDITRKLFSGTAEFFWGTGSLGGLPPMHGVEIAFAGRSNVGKSSLVNALTRRKALARTSSTPGRTQELNFFRIGEGQQDAFTLVDMPGYGYAAVGKEKVAAWTDLIYAYLRGRANLARVYVLIDARHGLKDNDVKVLDLLDKSAVSYQIVLTKADALGPNQLAERVQATEKAILRRPAAYPGVIATSSRNGNGTDTLQAAIVRLLHERGDK